MPDRLAAARRPVRPAVGPRLRVLLGVAFVLLALLGANSAYLVGVRALGIFGVDLLNWFVPWMLLGHVALGALVAGPLGLFALLHGATAWRRGNRVAALAGATLVAASAGLFLTGALLCRVEGFEFTERLARLDRGLIYWLHVALPVLCLILYGLHRRAGRPIRWRLGRNYALATAAVVALMCGAHSLDPRTWRAVSPEEGAEYFEPSLARTVGGTFIPAERLMTDDRCAECHPDAAAAHAFGAHKHSSFNNPFYLAAVRKTREAMLARDGNVHVARWCAGCHDPVPLASGAFDDPFYQDVTDPTAHAGITCAVCHGITEIGLHGGVRGNADFLLEAAEPYPFEGSDEPILKWLNRQLVRAKPALHKRSMLKPLHQSSEFCATCHKVSLPEALNDYKWLRGQNHYDSFRLSGVSGGGATGFYYPPQAHANCNACHMPRTPSGDVAATPGPDGVLSVHDHTFRGANTALAWLHGSTDAYRAHNDILRDSLRVDLFGVREGGEVDGALTAPLRPDVPTLTPGETVLLEVAVRTLTLGHAFTEGTADSNQAWVEIVVSSGGRTLFASGAEPAMDDVDPAAHVFDTFPVDRNGNRIARRNVRDLFAVLYNHQIPPGAAASLHYRLPVPGDLTAPLTVTARVRYRKFRPDFMRFVRDAARPDDPPLRKDWERPPIVTICTDSVTFPVAGLPEELNAAVNNPPRDVPAWERWNDYGIGALLKGTAELRQAADAFSQVEELGRADGSLNLARALHDAGDVTGATAALDRAVGRPEPPSSWRTDWLRGVLNRESGRPAEAVEDLLNVLRWDRPPTEEMTARGFDFGADDRVANLLGRTYTDLARRAVDEAERNRLQTLAIDAFERVLEVDVENVTALDNLARLHRERGESERADELRALHAKYKPDDVAAARALRLAREKYPNAAKAAEATVIYDLTPPPPRAPREPGPPGSVTRRREVSRDAP
ncbi:tetratricopeptide repeat protein [Alienimonas californiensis]|uniref:tetratricopeptide repeat protein n=1 Tax=Alienimonas californiensis TaxID=2527989 RepID=UPI0011A6CC34|nr:DUF1109 domain-containing protein [Alienimonas californiensis]